MVIGTQLFRETLASIASSQAALASNDEKLEKRSVDAGWLLQEGIFKIIKSESIAHLLSREETDNYDTLVRINEYVQTFTINFERIAAQLDALVEEIVIATTYTEAAKNIAQLEELLRLNVKHLTRSVTDEDGVVTLTPLDSDYPPKTDTWIMGKLEKKLSEKHPLTRLREMVTTAKKGNKTYAQLAKRLRNKMAEYESNKPSLSTNPPPALLRGHIASTSGFEHYPNTLQERSHPYSFDDRTEYSQGVESRWHETYGDGVEAVDEYQHDFPSPVTAFLGRRVGESQYGGDQQRQRVNEYERPFQPQHMAAAAGSAYQAPQVCLHYQRGNCSYGDRCSNLHEIPGSIDVKMSASEYQQYQQSKLAGQQRSMEAASHHQQGSYPSLHPTGLYVQRPPQPPGIPPGGRGPSHQYGGRGFGGRAPSGGRGGRSY